MIGRALGPFVAAALVSLATSTARADDPDAGAPAGPAAPVELVAEAAPVLGAGGPFFWGWNEFLVRLQNQSSHPMRGNIEVDSQTFGHHGGFESKAPYAVGAGASISVRVPMNVPAYSEVVVRVLDEADKELFVRRFSASGPWSVLLVDVTDPSHLRGAVHEASIAPGYAPAGAFAGSGSGPQLLLGSPRFDPATGDPILPDRAALYSSAAAVLMRTDILARLGGPELDALAGFVLSGGTLALVVARPEDMRSPILSALVGGAVTPTAVNSETLRELSIATGSAGKPIPRARSASDEVSKTLSGYAGGNLHGSPYGSSAYYGLGEVHLLAFDPTKKPGVDDPWVQVRMVDLARAAFDRRSSLVYRHGAPPGDGEIAQVRRQLDPNESSRWAIAAAALLLCLYSIVAGPLNFAAASKKGTPLRALRWLPIFAAVAFSVIVALGVAFKGIRGRARHLTLIEAGAGSTRGTARRWRGFFASQAKDLTVRTTDSSSVLASAVHAGSGEERDKMVIDRDGARLVDVAALPWQTVVVREDGFASLGDGITMLKSAAGSDITIVNRSGHDLRGAILKMPAGDPRYFARIKDGESVSGAAGRVLSASLEEKNWLAALARTIPAGTLDCHPLGGSFLRPILERDAPGLAEAWAALEQTAGTYVDWLPDGVPVLLGQLDGGEGRTSDSGLRLESDRLLVRIVGYGGRL